MSILAEAHTDADFWLEEQGRCPQAEFIRVQNMIWTMPRGRACVVGKKDRKKCQWKQCLRCQLKRLRECEHELLVRCSWFEGAHGRLYDNNRIGLRVCVRGLWLDVEFMLGIKQ